MSECYCYSCTKERWDSHRKAVKDLGLSDYLNSPLNRMFLCAKCGNKRCPHAADHRLECTGSNEPGQKGSLYEPLPAPLTARRG